MARDYHTAQDDFGSIVQRLQPMVLTNFVMWLDMKVAEFKVYGQMLLEQESRDLPNWYLRPNFNAETMVNAIKQKLQTPVSPTTEHLHSKSASHGPVSPTRRNRLAHSQSAKKLRTDSEKNADFSESAVVIQSQIEDPIIPLEDTDSSNHLISSDCTRAESPSYISTNVKVTDTDSRYRTLNKSSDLPHVEPLYSSRLLPKSEPVDEEFEILENRSRTTTSTISKSADNPELHVRVASQEIAVSSSNKITNTEKVAKTLVQSDGTMFMMPQTDKDVTDTSVGAAIDLLNQQLTTTRFTGDPSEEEKFGVLKVPHPSNLRLKPNSKGSVRVEHICKNLAKNKRKASSESQPQTNSSNLRNLNSDSEVEGSLDNCHSLTISDVKSVSDYTYGSTTMSSSTDINQLMDGDDGVLYKVKEEPECPPPFKTILPTRLFKCRMCTKSFPRKVELLQHTELIHGQEAEPISVLDCKDCGLRFMNIREFGDHMTSVHEANSMMLCRYCGKQFQVYQHYAAHINRHQGIKPFECPRCKQTFTFKFHFTRHFKKCGDLGSGLQCPECSKVYMSRRHLSDHIQGVHNARPRYLCKECGEQFVWQGALIRHRASRHKKK